MYKANHSDIDIGYTYSLINFKKQHEIRKLTVIG